MPVKKGKKKTSRASPGSARAAKASRKGGNDKGGGDDGSPGLSSAAAVLKTGA